MILLIALVILLLAVGLIAVAHYCLWGMTLNLEIKPLEVLNLAVTIGIFGLLQFFLTNKITDLRSEKDILITNINDVLATLKACRDSLSVLHGLVKITPKHTHEILQLFRRLSNGITHMEDALKMSQCHNLTERVKEVWHACDHYKYAATSAPFPVKPTSPAEQDRAFRDLSSKLQSLAFDINKYH
jgi:hypothetical protein